MERIRRVVAKNWYADVPKQETEGWLSEENATLQISKDEGGEKGEENCVRMRGKVLTSREGELLLSCGGLLVGTKEGRGELKEDDVVHVVIRGIL